MPAPAARTPSGPVCWLITQTSQAAAAYIGKARTCFRIVHPGAGPRQEARETRREGQAAHRARRGRAPSRGRRRRSRRRRSQGRRDRGAHEGRGARRRDKHGEEAGEEAAGMAGPRARPLPAPVRPRPTSKTPEGSIRAAGRARPSRRRKPATGTGSPSRRPSPPRGRRGAPRRARKGDEHAERVGGGMGLTAGRSWLESLARVRALMARIGKTQGIRLRMSPPRKAKTSIVKTPISAEAGARGGEWLRGADRLGLRRRRSRARGRRGVRLRGDLVEAFGSVRGLDHQDAGEAGFRVEGLGGLQGKRELALGDAQPLGRGVVDDTPFVGKEPGLLGEAGRDRVPR